MKDRKNFWIIDPYCAIPGDEWGYRHALSLCDAFSDGGYNIFYITANFSHATKKKRGCDWEVIEYKQYTKIILIPTREYRNHIGVRRLLWLRDFNKGIVKLFLNQQKPDLVYYPAPLIFGDSYIAKIKSKLGFKLILDIRDLWPEVLINKFESKIIQKILTIILRPVYIARSTAVKVADVITSPSESYLEKIGASEKLKYIIYYSPVNVVQLKRNMLNNVNLPIQKKDNEYWVVMTGTLGDGLDTHAIIEAAQKIQKIDAAIQILITGDGDKKEVIQKALNRHSLKNVHILGVLTLEQLHRLYHFADIGLSAYRSGSTVVMPTKAYDYISACLPVVNSLKGDFAEFIEKNKVGLNYLSADGDDLVRCILAIKYEKDLLVNFKSNLNIISDIFDREKQYNIFYKIAKEIMPN